MLTAEAATNAGLPVHIVCRSCHAPSRALDLAALVAAGKGELDLQAATKRGAFRCKACGSRKAEVMPIMADLVRLQSRLRWRCIDCGHDRHLTAVEAVQKYGFATPLDEVRRIEDARCSAAVCRLSIAFASTGDVLRKQQFQVSATAPRSPR